MDSLSTRLDALFALDQKRERGELTAAEHEAFLAARETFLNEAAQRPLAKQLGEALELVEILKADGAAMTTRQSCAITAALVNAMPQHHIGLFAALKAIQRTPPAAPLLPDEPPSV